jgi:hypothetical protein
MCNGNIAAYGKVISPQLAEDWRGLGGTLPMDSSYNSSNQGHVLLHQSYGRGVID